MPTAIIRDVSDTLGECELSWIERAPIDVARARRQHGAYREALERCGCRVVALAAEHALPDAVFVEDIALVLDEIAILTRPGAPSRRPESASIADALSRHRTLHAIDAPGTIDGGDVLRIGRTIHVGESARTNAAGIAAFEAIVAPLGYRVKPVRVRRCLHLKSAVTEVGDGLVLIDPDWIDRAAFEEYERIEIDPAETHAANGLFVGGRVIYPLSFPRTRQRLADAGVETVVVDVSELQKAEGAVTCCSLVFRDGPGAS
ncbi:MAG TPA: dimethylargininase [Rhodanobacteraceae bacterium]|nr:dimethylargininase [Rhodanobacteraceae bacterium]